MSTSWLKNVIDFKIKRKKKRTEMRREDKENRFQTIK